VNDTFQRLGECSDLPRELLFEYPTFPPAKQALKCVCDRLTAEFREEEASGAVTASTPDGTFQARLTTAPKSGGGLKVAVLIQLTTEEQQMAVTACFGEAQQDRKVGPTTLTFAETVLATPFSGDVDAFVKDICSQLSVDPMRFAGYRAMVLTSSALPKASDTLKRAAQKLRQL
jgi:hypothetical protein